VAILALAVLIGLVLLILGLAVHVLNGGAETGGGAGDLTRPILGR
jgi:hypothetical protein